jgi:hypothetical protein
LTKEYRGTGRPGSVESVCRELDPAQARPAAPCCGQGAPHLERVDDSAEITNRPGQPGAGDPADSDHVLRIEGGNVMGDDVTLTAPTVPAGDAELDDVAVFEAVEVVQARRAAVRRHRMG